MKPLGRRIHSSPSSAKPEVFTPERTYPPMTVSELAAAMLYTFLCTVGHVDLAIKGRKPLYD